MKHLFSEVGGFQLAWSVFDALPQVLLLLDEERRVHAVNEAAEAFLGSAADHPLERKFGDLVHCVHALSDYRGCGHSESCSTCQVRASTEAAIDGQRIERREVTVTRSRQGQPEEVTLVLSAAPIEVNGHKLAVMVMEEVSSLRDLRAAIPACATCGKLAQAPEAWAGVAKLTRTRPELRNPNYHCADCRGDSEAA